jgi:phosphate transport system substrate-binding protein
MKSSRFIVAAIAASLIIAQPAHADQITGSGSSFIANFINECRVQYGKVSGHNIEYTPLGSGAGINMFMQNTVDFAASDVAASQVNKAKDFVYVPLVAGPIAIAYRIDGYKGKIQLKKETLAKIFAGDITKWNDPQIIKDNTIKKVKPKLPNLQIMVFYRADSSGTTQVVAEYLSAIAPSIWTKAPNKSFTQAFPKTQLPLGTFSSVAGTNLMASQVASTNGAIGYMESSYATNQNLAKASIENGAGVFMQPTSEAASAFLSDFEPEGNGIIVPNYNNKDKKAYNISSFSYGLAPTQASDKANIIKGFFKYTATSCATLSAKKLEYSPLTGSALTIAKAQIALIGSKS